MQDQEKAKILSAYFSVLNSKRDMAGLKLLIQGHKFNVYQLQILHLTWFWNCTPFHSQDNEYPPHLLSPFHTQTPDVPKENIKSFDR